MNELDLLFQKNNELLASIKKQFIEFCVENELHKKREYKQPVAIRKAMSELDMEFVKESIKWAYTA